MAIRMSREAEDFLIEEVMILWARRMNTADIAKKWQCSEAEICRYLAIGRERKRAKKEEVA